MTPFIRKLQHGARLTADDEAILTRLAEPLRRSGRGDIISAGSEPRFIVLVIEGWVCRYKYLENGKRQITSLYLPGDLCEPFGALPQVSDQTLGALTPVLLGRITPASMRNAARTNPRIEEALWWDLLVSDSVACEHKVSLGRRSATERLGHFFCEMHLRLTMVGLVDRDTCEVPLTQADLADLFGLSVVHVNRSLQELRGDGLLSFRDRRMTIHNMSLLRELSLFDPSYLTVSDSSFDLVTEPVQR